MPSTIMSVSSDKISHCYMVVRLMQELKICGDVTENTSVAPNGALEVGCRIMIAGPNSFDESKTLWDKLKSSNRFDCAFIETKDNRSGCVYDMYRESQCPSSLKST